MFGIHVERVLGKDIDTVFEAIADHASYERFPGVSRSVLIEEGKDEKNGTGALRVIGAGRLELTERITQFERPNRMHYCIEKSSPFAVQHTKGEIVLKPEGDQTRVIWISEGHVQVPLLGRMMDRMAERSFSKAFSSLLKRSTFLRLPSQAFGMGTPIRLTPLNLTRGRPLAKESSTPAFTRRVLPRVKGNPLQEAPESRR